MGYTLSLIVSANNTYESSLKLPVNKVGQEKATGQVLTVPIKTKLALVCPFNPLDGLIISVFSPKVSPWMFRIWGLEGMMSKQPGPKEEDNPGNALLYGAYLYKMGKFSRRASSQNLKIHILTQACVG